LDSRKPVIHRENHVDVVSGFSVDIENLAANVLYKVDQSYVFLAIEGPFAMLLPGPELPTV